MRRAPPDAEGVSHAAAEYDRVLGRARANEARSMSTIEAMRSVSTSPGGSSVATDGESIAEHGRALHEVDVKLRYQ